MRKLGEKRENKEEKGRKKKNNQLFNLILAYKIKLKTKYKITNFLDKSQRTVVPVNSTCDDNFGNLQKTAVVLSLVALYD